MTRRCSNFNSINGHKTRTCSRKGGGGRPRLFGVRLTDGPFIKKSASMGNLLHRSVAAADLPEEYHSDDPDRCSESRRTRNKGIPWTEEEHRTFLLGLNNLGKGDWRGISKGYVPSRTPSQVASHAQKYFICQTSANRKKKRNSLFDMAPTVEANSTVHETNRSHSRPPSLDLCLKPTIMPLPFQLVPQDACSVKEDAGAGSSSHQQISRTVQEEPTKEIAASMSNLSLAPLSLDLSLGLPGGNQ